MDFHEKLKICIEKFDLKVALLASFVTFARLDKV